MLNTAYVSWKEPGSHAWYVVCRLTEKQDGYEFAYTKGAIKAKNFVPFPGFDDLYRKYFSTTLFPLFSNRLIRDTRPEYRAFIEWLELPKEASSPVDILSRSGGRRATDSLQIFKRLLPEEDGKLTAYFFAHGLSHLTDKADERVSKLFQGEKLEIVHEKDNPKDPYAALVTATNPKQRVGYLPRYMSRELLLLQEKSPESFTVQVQAIRPDIPYHYRLLCKIQGLVSPELFYEFNQNKEFEDIC